MEEERKRGNHMIKMPFKQVPVVTLNNEYRIEDDLVDPAEDLRLTTAFTLKRVRNGLRRLPPPSQPQHDNGRLLKAKLRPMRPVHSRGPTIYTCEGIQPEFRKPKDTPSPSRMRHLKEQYLEICRLHQQQDELGESGAGVVVTPLAIQVTPPNTLQLVSDPSGDYSGPLPSPQRDTHPTSIPEINQQVIF